jgi:L-ascorbate metabolism protein UlaG (beta-lactamase superfamily)
MTPFLFLIMNILLLILALILVAAFVIFMMGVSISGPKYRGPVSDHFDGRKFLNPGGAKAKGGLEVFKWMIQRNQGSWKKEYSAKNANHPPAHFRDGIRITFVNHSTFLIQVDGVNILTDPVWSGRVSPFSWIGPKRMRPPGISLEQLPRIHIVLLTHNHYDHLDLATMRVLFGAHHPQIVLPLGVKKFLDDNHVSGSVEVDWWEEVQPAGIKIRAVPAQHFSGRGLLDRDATLWCGYVIKTMAGTLYFAGDTGYHPGIFKEIGDKLGPFAISFLPIGAYKPDWFMAPIHVSPEESVKIHLDTRSSRSIAMHFGTFPLADDGSDDPVDELKTAMAKHNVSDDSFIVLREGESEMI